MSEDKPNNAELRLLDVFDQKSLDELIQHIYNSGALGRSKIYSNLLKYLIDRTEGASPPKEIEVAIEVLGRNTDFDVAKDSVVRVYIHQLRKKLDRYYNEHYPQKYGREPSYRIVIPKGEYTVAAVHFEPGISADPVPSTNQENSVYPKDQARRKLLRPWVIAASLLLAANLSFLALDRFFFSKQSSSQSVAQFDTWQSILSDRSPVLIVVGDYYIFGELDEAGNVKRMVREFNINSKMDLEDLFMTQPELAWKYNDLDLSYVPEGSAFALNSIASVLPFGGKDVKLKMMSELTTQDITTHHIVYVGYVSGLDRLSNFVFAASGLKIGSNYDELINKETQTTYVSSAGLPSFQDPFTDYGLFSVFPSANGHRIVVVAGMRDAGLIHTAQALASRKPLSQMEETLLKIDNKRNLSTSAFEVLFEVRGINRKNFEANLVYSNFIDADTNWMDELSGTVSEAASVE